MATFNKVLAAVVFQEYTRVAKNTKREVLVVAKFINKLIAKRDQLAQDVYYLLLDIPLCKGFRNIITLNCRQEDD